MKFDGVGLKNSSLINFYAKTTNVKVSLHLHVEKIRTNVLNFDYNNLH
jgi:hypothetical protein